MRKSSKKSIILPETHLSGKFLLSGQKVILDGEIEVEVKFQRILKNFTTICLDGKNVEVRTERLKEIKGAL